MLNLNKLEMQLDKALLEDDLEEWILNKRKKNNLMVQINKWYWYPERDYYALCVIGKCPGFYHTLAGYEWDSYMLTNGELSSGVQIGSWQEADMAKVKELLLKEAERRYPVGTKFKSALGGYKCEIIDNTVEYHYDPNGDYIWLHKGHKGVGNRPYQNGKWGEIAEELLNPPVNPLWLLDEDSDIRPFNQLNEEVPLRENVMFFRTEQEAKDVAYARELKKVTEELKKKYGIE